MSPLVDDSQRIIDAIACGASGDRPGALAHLKPIIDRGPGAIFAMLHALANVAVVEQKPETGTFLGIAVETTDGHAASIDQLPAGHRFAAQFTTAVANDDLDQADALYRALLVGDDFHAATGLAEGIGAVYDMAVATTVAMVELARQRKRGQQ
jgi:hypothetical protein